jgi:hypothetical protein
MTVPADLLAVLKADYRHIRYLLEVDTTPAFRICSGLVDISHGGNVYTARGWKPGAVIAGDPTRAGFTATIEDIDGDLEALAYSQGWTEKRTATLTILGSTDGVTWATAWSPVTAPIIVAAGGAVFFNLEARGAVGLYSRAGLQIGDSRCRLVFKGARCKYSGPDLTCLRTYDDCAARTGGDNTANFRGARLSPAPGTIINLGKGGRSVPTSPPVGSNWSGGARRQPQMIDNPHMPPASTNGSPPPPAGGGQTPHEPPGHGGHSS